MNTPIPQPIAWTLTLFAVLAFGLLGCSKKSEEGGGGEVTKVSIAGNDQMKFDKSEIKVPKGQKVELTLKHSGQMAKAAMGHNWVLLKQGTDDQAFATAAIQAKATDYIPPSMKDKVIAHTKTLGGGETDTITFDAPEPGTYVFLCSFPGHYALMKGKFIVE